MLFAIDYDGTFSRDPVAFTAMVTLLRSHKHSVVMVTGRAPTGQYGADVRRAIGDLMPIVFTDGDPKRQAALAAGYKVDIWVDDMPEMVG